MKPKIIYVESCPVCGDGLCRIRVCVHNHHVFGVVLCDECEAIWTSPSMQERVLRQADDSEPSCPECDKSLWGKGTHWANVGEVCLLGWYDKVHVVAE